MKHIITAILCMFLWVPVIYAGTVPVTGTIYAASGARFNGTVRMTLSYPGTDTTSGRLVSPQAATFKINNGTIQSGATITPNDIISPGNTFYVTAFFASSGAMVRQNNFYVSGSQIDLGTATPTALTSSNLSFNNFTSLVNVTSSSINGVPTCVRAGASTGAKIIAAINELPSTGGIVDCGDQTSGTISADIFSGITKKVLVYMGAGSFTQSVQINLHDGQMIVGQGPINRWRSGVNCPTTFNYTGTGAAIGIVPAAGVGRDSTGLKDICFDGTGASGSVDGILLDGSGASSYIEGIEFDHVGVYNFPRNQIRGLGTVFDVRFLALTAHNSGRSADNLIQYQGNTASKWQFFDPWLVPYTAGKWALFGGITGALPSNGMANVIFYGGTIAGGDGVAGNSNGANGVWVNGGLQIYGTAFNASEASQPRSIGIRYTGSNGAIISPSECGFWGTCVEIGNSGQEVGGTARTGDPSAGAQITGTVGFNNNCVAPITCSDVHIVTNASRKGTIVNIGGNFTASGNYGQVNSLPYVFNEASAPNDVLIQTWTLATAGKPTIGPLTLDVANTRLGIGVDPTLALQVRTGNNNGFRLEDTNNTNNVEAQIFNDSTFGAQLQLSTHANPSVVRSMIRGNGTSVFSTVGAATQDASAIMTLESTTVGFLPPRMTTTQRDAISAPTSGLMIYNTTTGLLNLYNGAWVAICVYGGAACP